MRYSLRDELYPWDGDQSIPLSLSVWQRIGAMQQRNVLALLRRPDAQHDNMQVRLSGRDDVLFGERCTCNMCNELSGRTGAERQLPVHLPGDDVWNIPQPGVLPGEPDLRFGPNVYLFRRPGAVRSDELLCGELSWSPGAGPGDMPVHLSCGNGALQGDMCYRVYGWRSARRDRLHLCVSIGNSGVHANGSNIADVRELYGEPGAATGDLHLWVYTSGCAV
jgi:hypothetical protein